MGLFSKKKKEEDVLPPLPEIPEMPEMADLPALPPLPGEEQQATEPLPRQPRFAPAQAYPMPQLSERPRPFLQMPQMPHIPQISEAPPMNAGPATVFVRIDKYKDVMETISAMESKLDELKVTLNTISAIKTKESEIIDGWNAMLQQARSKIDEVSSKLARPQE